MIAPEYQRALYKEVKGARYVGYESSVTNNGAALAVDMRYILLACGDWTQENRIGMALACKRVSKADQESSADKHSDGLGSSLDGGRYTHNGRTKPDCSTTPYAVGQVWGKWIPSQRTNVLYANDQRLQTICLNILTWMAVKRPNVPLDG